MIFISLVSIFWKEEKEAYETTFCLCQCVYTFPSNQFFSISNLNQQSEFTFYKLML
jgi:hypothetical protein